MLLTLGPTVRQTARPTLYDCVARKTKKYIKKTTRKRETNKNPLGLQIPKYN